MAQKDACTLYRLQTAPSVQELEDMLLRYERQLKAEIQARQAAESAAAEALAAMGGQQPGHLKGQQHSPEWQQQQEQLQQVGGVQHSVCLGSYGCSKVLADGRHGA